MNFRKIWMNLAQTSSKNRAKSQILTHSAGEMGDWQGEDKLKPLFRVQLCFILCFPSNWIQIKKQNMLEALTPISWVNKGN